MGRSIIDYHLGAYFKADMPYQEFEQILDEIDFHNDYEDDGTGAKYENFYFLKF